MEYSFELDLTWGTKIQELDLIKKKKQTLDQLFSSEKISQATYEYLEKKLTEETTDLEAQLKSLSDNMAARAQELEKKIWQLEISLANLEMYHVTGEIDDKTYEIHNKTILLGLESAKQELVNVKNSLLNAISGAVETIEPPSKPEAGAEEAVEIQETEEQKILEITTAECKSIEEPIVTTEPTKEEPVETMEPIQEVAIESTSDEPVQSEVPSLVSSTEEIHEPSTEAETTSES